MRNFLISLMIAIGGSAAFYLVGVWLGLPPDLVKGVAGLPALSIKNIYELLEARSAKKALTQAGSENLKTIDGFWISPFYLFVATAIMVMALFPVLNGLYGALTGVAFALAGQNIDAQIALMKPVIMMTAVPLEAIVSFYIGRWIGMRCADVRIAVVISIVAMTIGLSLYELGALMLVSGDFFKQLWGEDRTSDIIESEFLGAVPNIAFFCIVGVIGVVIGRRRRFARYLGFVLGLLSPEGRASIVDLAGEEALRLSLRRAGAASARTG